MKNKHLIGVLAFVLTPMTVYATNIYTPEAIEQMYVEYNQTYAEQSTLEEKVNHYTSALVDTFITNKVPTQKELDASVTFKDIETFYEAKGVDYWKASERKYAYTNSFNSKGQQTTKVELAPEDFLANTDVTINYYMIAPDTLKVVIKVEDTQNVKAEEVNKIHTFTFAGSELLDTRGVTE